MPQYVGANGFVLNAEDAINVQGPQGPQGKMGKMGYFCQRITGNQEPVGLPEETMGMSFGG